MARHASTLQLIEAVQAILAEDAPMTLRQIHYQLVSRQGRENTYRAYKTLSPLLVDARRRGEVGWEQIEGRLRRPREVNMWEDAGDFARWMPGQYRRDVWATQPRYVECWVEKDALSGVFSRTLAPYGMAFHVGRGYDGWSSVYNAAEVYKDRSDRRDAHDILVLYFGDMDPSGEDMPRSLRERLADRGVRPDIRVVSLTEADVSTYHLAQNFTPPKETDRRTPGYLARHNGVRKCWELDALPQPILRTRLIEAVEGVLDMDALRVTWAREARERAAIARVLAPLITP
jgi:hypothetical protein